jgi:hypothetical protein
MAMQDAPNMRQNKGVGSGFSVFAEIFSASAGRESWVGTAGTELFDEGTDCELMAWVLSFER